MSERTLGQEMRETALEALNASRQEEEVEEAEDAEPIEETAEEAVDEPDEHTEEADNPAPEEEPEDDAEADDDAEEETAQEDDPEIVNPPTTWRAAAKAAWKSVSPDIRREVLKRESDISRGISEYKQKAEFGDRLDRTILPYQPILQQRGLSAEQAVSESLGFIHTMMTATPEQKGMVLQNLARMYGADLSVKQDENSMKLQQQLQPLYQELNQLRQNRQQQESMQSQRLHDEINAFATAVNENGALSHPYFENVRGLMASLIESGQATGLDDAYKIAIKAHPDTSDLIASEQAATKEAKRQAEAKKRADKAKKNAEINISKKARHDEQPNQPVGDMYDTAKEALAQIRARAS